MKLDKLKQIGLMILRSVIVTAISAPTPAHAQSAALLIFPALRNVPGNLLPDDQTNSDAIDWRMVSIQEAKARGIGSFESENVTCSATLIDAGGGDDAQAYLLTAAHCYSKADGSILLPKEIITEVSASEYAFYPNNFHDASEPFSDAISAQSVRYATMKGTDVMIVALNSTVGLLKKRGLQAFKIAGREARLGEPLTIYGVPTNGIDEAHNGLHEMHCKVNAKRFQKSRLGNSGSPKTYTLREAIVETCSSTGGVSGGPVLSADNEILAVVSSSKRLAEASRLTLGSDLTEAQKNFVWNHLGVGSGAADVSKLVGCFDGMGNFNIVLPACRLEKPCADSTDATSCAAVKCAAGDGAACFDASLFENGCKLGDGPSCESLGASYARGQDLIRALPFLAEACSLSQQAACGMAAYVTEKIDNQGFTPAARAYATGGCLGMDGLACRLTGRGTNNVDEAIGSYLTGCTYGDKQSCLAAGQLFEQGVLGSKAPRFAQKLFTMGGKPAVKHQNPRSGD